MASLTDTLQQSLTPQTVKQISRQLGADEQQTQRGIDVALPLLISALSRNTEQPAGAASLERALKRDHDGSILNNPTAAVQSSQTTADGRKILGHILGNDQESIETTVSRGTGIDAAALLQILAPLLLGALGKQTQSGGLDASSLPDVLSSERSKYQQKDSGLMGAISQMLDTNRNGSALDEVAGMLGSLLSQRTQRQ